MARTSQDLTQSEQELIQQLEALPNSGAGEALAKEGGEIVNKTIGGGGSGTPGGLNTQVQFNDGGSFGGDAGFVYNKTTDTATLTGNILVDKVGLDDSDASHKLYIDAASDLTADRTLSLVTGDVSRTLTLTGDTSITGTNTGDQTITLTGDVTGTGTGTFATTIADDSVTYAKMQNTNANSVLARAASSSGDVSGVALGASELLGRGSTGDIAPITTGDGVSISGTTLTADVQTVNGQTGVVVLDTNDIADSTNARYVTDAQLTVIGNTSGTNTGDQDLSGLVPYTGATTNVNLGANSITVPDVLTTDVQATGSAGVIIKNSGGTAQAEFGSGGGTNTTINGTTNIAAASADYHQVAGGTGTITDTATGSSTNININLVPKGTGRLQAGGSNIPTVSSTDTLTNKTLTNANATAQTLTDGTTVNWDTNSGNFATLTLGGNRTLAAPTNLKNGGSYVLILKQDATGTRTVTWNAVFKWAGGTAPTLTTTASATDILTFISDGTNLYGSILKAFA